MNLTDRALVWKGKWWRQCSNSTASFKLRGKKKKTSVPRSSWEQRWPKLHPNLINLIDHVTNNKCKVSWTSYGNRWEPLKKLLQNLVHFWNDRFGWHSAPAIKKDLQEVEDDDMTAKQEKYILSCCNVTNQEILTVLVLHRFVSSISGRSVWSEGKKKKTASK